MRKKVAVTIPVDEKKLAILDEKEVVTLTENEREMIRISGG